MKTLQLNNCGDLDLVAFTGHRPCKLGGYDEDNYRIVEVKKILRKAIIERIEDGCDGFISGMAMGVDIWAAEIVLELKEKYPHIKLVAAVPFEGQQKMWPYPSQERWRNVLGAADHVEYVCDPGYAPWKMQKRNEWMVNSAKWLIAIWDGTKGGTGNCVAYAKKNNIEIVHKVPPRELTYPHVDINVKDD